MKNKPFLTPVASLGLLTAADFSNIDKQVAESIALARQRQEAASAADGKRSAAVALPPTNNMGGKFGDSTFQPARLVIEEGQVLEIPARRGWGGDAAFVDWLNFTTDESDFFFGTSPTSDEEVIDLVSYRCEILFGFGITAKRPLGANFYKDSYVLGEGCGMVCHGGQKGTVLVMLSGVGCSAAREGWEQRTQDFLSKAGCRAKITRIDLSHDCIDGEISGPMRPGERRGGYSVNAADNHYEEGMFSAGGRMPDIEHRGNWRRPNGRGRTVYIGHRANGKYARIYEKGKQLGDKSSPWVRIEVELKGVDRLIPFDALTRAGEFLAATYPALGWISERQERILTKQKETEISYKVMCDWLYRQCGAALNVMHEIEGSAGAVIAKVIKPGMIPARLKQASWMFGGDYVHNEKRERLPVEAMYEACLV